MQCPKCKAEVEENTLKCPNCGTKIASVCKDCGHINLITAVECAGCNKILLKICSECGSANLPDAVSCRKCKKEFKKLNSSPSADFSHDMYSQQKAKSKLTEAIKDSDAYKGYDASRRTARAVVGTAKAGKAAVQGTITGGINIPGLNF